MTRKRIAHAAQRQAARKLYADTIGIVRLGIAEEDADEFNEAARLVAETGVYAYLQLAGVTRDAIQALSVEWSVTPDEALERLASRRSGNARSSLVPGEPVGS
jgi:hypothetical protein